MRLSTWLFVLVVGVQDKNEQKPDSMAVNNEARAVLRDARCIVRESGVGDNASRVSFFFHGVRKKSFIFF